MFNYLRKSLNIFKLLSTHLEKNKDKSKQKEKEISPDITKNLKALKNILGKSNDVVFREFTFGNKVPIKAALLFIDGLADSATVNNSILKPLMYDSNFAGFNDTHKANDIISFIETKLLSVGEVNKLTTLDQIVDGCLSGNTLLIINGETQALSLGTQGWETRGINEPQTEVVVRGPREGFTETLRVNTSMLRRKIRNPDLILENMKIGQKTQTAVCIAYVEGIVDQGVVAEVKKRLQSIDTDAILESGYIEQFIEDAPFSPFSTVANSEKPDIVAAKILEGRVAIMVDGTPIVLTVPMLFLEGFQSAEDYYSRPYYSSIVRTMRFLAFLVSILGPGFYVAVLTFHQELIPAALIITIAAATEGTPFPTVVEALGMGIVFEILREAGVRLPRPVGQAISIVGALVIGDAVVSAGFISAPMVIVVAFTAIASFVVPTHSDAESILRIILTLLAGSLGLFGVTMGMLGVLIHLCSLRSLGTPYLSPLAPLSPLDLKDVFLRFPLWLMITRPRTIGRNNYQRQSLNLLPRPPQDGKEADSNEG